MDKNKCSSCGKPKCSCKNKEFTKAVIEIDNPEQITLMRRVVIPASMGDDTAVPPVVGKYHNVLLYYEANHKSYLYSSDGIPTLLANGLTDYEEAVNLPQINGNTLIGDKTGEELGLQDKLTAGENITIENDVISATDTTYGPATDTEIGLVKPGSGLDITNNGELSVNWSEGLGDINGLQTVRKDTIVNAINSANLNDIEYYRRKYSNNYRLFTDKGGVQYFDNVTIYKDIYDGSFNYQIDVESFKNSGGNDIYVNPATTESASVQNGTSEHPYSSVLKAYNVASDGDTIWLFDGIYYRTNCNLGSTTYLDKSVNLLPYQTGKIYFFNGDKLSFSQNTTYSNVYQATRSNTVCAYDIRYRDDDIFPLLTLANSLDDCATTLNSYYTSGSTVYVNIGEEATSEKVIFGLNISASMIQIRPSTSNIKVYLEGITGCGGDYGIFDIASASGYTCEVIANKCNFYYSFNDSSNAISVKGANTIFKDCKACFGARDGFNYHKQGSVLCNSIELDCVGANNGLITTQNNNNGSTTHDGNKCLRINGVYFNNRGGNVTDVQTNTYSLNINCAAFDSKSSGTTSKGDFIAQQAGVTMDLYNCYSKGSSSYVNIYGVANTTMNVHNCLFDNAYSDGTINID